MQVNLMMFHMGNIEYHHTYDNATNHYRLEVKSGRNVAEEKLRIDAMHHVGHLICV
jgi:hypothetical protein